MSIEEGRELGRVGSLLIDPDEIRLVGFTLSVPDARSPVKVVPVETISSFGTFALTVGKSDAIADLAGNDYYLSLFEKDIVLLGTEVRDTLDKLVGFVKDAHMDPATGALLRFRITSDKGFMSPYNATVPVSVIRAVEKDRVIIDQDHVVAYHKESHLATSGEERRAFVPLVTQTDDLKETVREHISAELEKIRKELHDYLFQQHEEYFVSRERKPLEQAVTEAVRQEFDARIHDTVNNALLDFAGSLPASVPLETFDAQIKQLRDSLEQAAEQARVQAEQRTTQAAEQAAGFIEAQKQAASELERSLRTLLTSQLNQASQDTRDRLASMDEQLTSDTGSLAENLGRIEKSLLARIEQTESQAGDRTAEAGARVERLHSVFKDEIAVLRSEIEERIHATVDRVNRSLDATRQDHSDLSDSVQSLLMDMESGLKQRLDKQIADKMSALENKLTQAIKKDQTHTAAFDTRLLEQNQIAEKTLEQTQALETKIASLSKLLQDMQLTMNQHQAANLEAASDKEKIFETRLNALASDQAESMAAMDERAAAMARDVAAQLDQLQVDVNARFASVEENWNMADAAMTEAEQTAITARNDIETIKQQIQSLAAAMPDADALRAVYEERLNEALHDFDFLKNALGTMQQVQMSVLDRESNERAALGDQVRELSLKSDESAEALSGLRAAVDGIQQAVSEQNTRGVGMAGALEERIDQIQDGFDELRGNGLHALQRLASVESALTQTNEQLAATASRDELNAVTDSLARFQELDREIESLKSLAASLDTRETVRAIEFELATLREQAGQLDQERDQTRLAALDHVRADMDERIRTMHQEISGLLTQSSEETTARAASDIEQVRHAIEEMNSLIESRAGLSADQAESLIQSKLDAAIAHFKEQLAPAVSHDDIQELDARFRDLLKGKLDALRDLLLGALDGRIDELKSQDEAARIEHMIDDSVQKSLDALQGQIMQALETAGAAAPRDALDTVADLARRAQELSAQHKTDFDAAMEELDARFQNIEETMRAQTSSGDAIAELRDRLAELEASAPEAHRLESLQSAAHSISDAETRLTRKVKDVQESTEILSDKLNALLGKNEFDEEKQEILQLLDDKTARLETGLEQLHGRLVESESRSAAPAHAAPDQFAEQLEKQIAITEKRLGAKSEKATERALARIQEQMKSLADELAEDTRRQADEAISAVNAFQARLMNMFGNIDRIEALAASLDSGAGPADVHSGILEQEVAELRARLEALDQASAVPREIAARLESLEKEMSWATHTVQELASSPIMSVDQALARQERVLMEMTARVENLEVEGRAPGIPDRAIQNDLDEFAERIAALENRAAATPEDLPVQLAGIQNQLEHMRAVAPDIALPHSAPAPDAPAITARLEELARTHFEQLAARMDQAVDQKLTAIEDRLQSVQLNLEKLHAIKDDIIRTAVEPDSHMHQTLEDMGKKLHRYEDLMEEESQVVNRLLDEVQAAQELMTRTQQAAASHEQLQALAARIQEVQSGMERVVAELSSRTGDTDLVDKVHRDILDTLRKKGLRELIFPARDLFSDDDIQNEQLPPEITEEEAVSIFGDRLTRNILGSRVIKDLLTDDNRCIIHEGEIVDNELIQRAKQHGKFLELTLNVDSDPG